MQTYKYTINGKEYEVTIGESKGNEVAVSVNGTPYTVTKESKQVAAPAPQQAAAPAPAPKAATPAPAAAPAPQPKPAAAPAPAAGGAAHAVKSPLPGVILDITCNVGDAVKKGQKLLVLEAMKMENDIKADKDGVVASINVAKGESIQEGHTLVTIS
ncbi:MAG: biotin/lipoyl-containing protein [Porphyromonas sp.]|nr:biotin/lipoyl-containing protein [Porphyromonas sp.]